MTPERNLSFASARIYSVISHAGSHVQLCKERRQTRSGKNDLASTVGARDDKLWLDFLVTAIITRDKIRDFLLFEPLTSGGSLRLTKPGRNALATFFLASLLADETIPRPVSKFHQVFKQ